MGATSRTRGRNRSPRARSRSGRCPSSAAVCCLRRGSWQLRELLRPVLAQEEIRSTEGPEPVRLADVVDAECRVAWRLAGQQRLTERVPDLTRLAVRALRVAARTVRVSVQDRLRPPRRIRER